MSFDAQRQRRARSAKLAEARGPARSAPVEPTFFQRFECKYLVRPSIVQEIRDYLQPFTRPDSFASRCRGYRYPICSLYLDSQDLVLYRQTLCGEKDRFKLRIRAYSDSSDEAVFFEVKRRVNTVVHKRRAGMSRAQTRELLADNPTPVMAQLEGRRLNDAEYFLYHRGRIEARPVMRIKYWREAYEATGNEPVRITFDTELQHAITLSGDVNHNHGDWVKTRLEETILEIKFTERFPWWLEELVRRFELRQQSVPKYVMSMDQMLLDERRASLSLAGMTLPPRGHQ